MASLGRIMTLAGIFMVCAMAVRLLGLFWPHVHFFDPHGHTHISQIEAYFRSIYRHPSYSVRILSYDALMIYVVDFIPKHERNYLLRLGGPLFERSEVMDPDGTGELSEYRTSSTAYLPDGDPIVERIIARAAEFQGYTRQEDNEGLQMTRYRAG
ncbi:hypothetical protein BJ170DRAFT_695817 [Xylariales sp. AK1849]|nr:hypothetical protein BJ170DRAFT_695817 [Xylariales sp. AK1849]